MKALFNYYKIRLQMGCLNLLALAHFGKLRFPPIAVRLDDSPMRSLYLLATPQKILAWHRTRRLAYALKIACSGRQSLPVAQDTVHYPELSHVPNRPEYMGLEDGLASVPQKSNKSEAFAGKNKPILPVDNTKYLL
jgi:hypothetical protein